MPPAGGSMWRSGAMKGGQVVDEPTGAADRADRAAKLHTLTQTEA
jgi:hypothetical protein